MRRPLFPLDPVKEKMYLPSAKFVEVGSEGCDDLKAEEIENEDVRRVFVCIEKEPIKQVYHWFGEHKNEFSPTTLLLGMKNNGGDPIPKCEVGNGLYDAIFVKRPLHTIYELDKFLFNANENLNQGGYLVCCCRTSSVKKAGYITASIIYGTECFPRWQF